jgi:hypothetical protein
MKDAHSEIEKASIALTVVFLIVIFVPVLTYILTKRVFAKIQNEKKSKLYEIKVDSPSSPINSSPEPKSQTEKAVSIEPAKSTGEKAAPPQIPDQFNSLYEGLETNRLSALMYMTVCTVRGLFHFTFLVLLIESPFAQALLISITNLTMIIYMLTARPSNTVVNTVKLFGNEFIIFVTYILALILAGHDYVQDTDIDRRMKVGHGIIILNMIFYYWSLVFQVLDALWSIWVIIKEKLDERKKAAEEAKKKKESEGVETAKGESEAQPILLSNDNADASPFNAKSEAGLLSNARDDNADVSPFNFNAGSVDNFEIPEESRKKNSLVYSNKNNNSGLNKDGNRVKENQENENFDLEDN